ncbi:MAG TPA: type ISP restriction/modification enzyme [Lentimicrobium sp.]|nr:type ISP restriction/modification enzyme [Lentimicrobium sp.]
MKMKFSPKLFEKLTVKTDLENETVEIEFPENDPPLKIEVLLMDLLSCSIAIQSVEMMANRSKNHKRVSIVPHLPKKYKTFVKLAEYGETLTYLLNLVHPVDFNYIPEYPVEGNNVVTKLKHQNNRLYINDAQYFEPVDEDIWLMKAVIGLREVPVFFYDKKKKPLSETDIKNFKRLIGTLYETRNTRLAAQAALMSEMA